MASVRLRRYLTDAEANAAADPKSRGLKSERMCRFVADVLRRQVRLNGREFTDNSCPPFLGRNLDKEIARWYRGSVRFITDLRANTVIKGDVRIVRLTVSFAPNIAVHVFHRGRLCRKGETDARVSDFGPVILTDHKSNVTSRP